MADLSFGERAAGVGFNPSGDPLVDDLKAAIAQFIDQVDDLRETVSAGTSAEEAEVKRMCSIAITEAQAAQMWAVKAATWVK